MSEEDSLTFDLSMKKKKKKKKTPFDVDAALNENEVAAEATPPEPEIPDSEETHATELTPQTNDDDLSLDFGGMKKKKKKKKPFDMDEMAETLPEKSESSEPVPTVETIDAGPSEDMDEDLGFSLPAKKKKKKKKVDFEELVAEEEDDMDDDDLLDGRRDERVSGNAVVDGRSWSGSDRDYTYDELLSRVFDIMREKNPDMVAGEKKKFVMRPPQVLKVGTRKSSFANFSEICRLLHRQPKHVLAFLLAELGTSGSVDGNNQLIIRGKYNQKQIENVLRRYIKEYVTCHTCRSPDTLLQKDTRLFFLQCETCGSRCSVASIKSGFQAVTGKRAAIRAKTA
ncbi:hypothetical protein ScPMuIL_002024 [Solemya velum]